MKVIFNIIYKIGFLLIFIFLFELMGVYKVLFNLNIVSMKQACILMGTGCLFLIPEYLLSKKEYEKKFNEYNPLIASYWVFALLMGIFLIVIPFFVNT